MFLDSIKSNYIVANTTGWLLFKKKKIE